MDVTKQISKIRSGLWRIKQQSLFSRIHRSYFVSMSSNQCFFVEILSTDGISRKIALVNQQTTLGRHSSCTIQIGLNNLRVSNRHAVILIDDTRVVIEDLGSTNHLFVNGKQVTKIQLNHNDIIRFGSQGPQLRFIFEKQDNVQQLSSQTGAAITQESHLFDVSPNTESCALPILSENEQAFKGIISADNPSIDSDSNLFDVSPEMEERNLRLPVEHDQITPKKSRNPLNSKKSEQKSGKAEDDQLFDVSPGKESIELSAPFHISNTMEISSRLQKQIMNTQDIDILVKNPKTRAKVLKNDKIGEQQKRFITTVTNAYLSMRRKYFIIFGLIIAFLVTGILWFANGYFSYKNQLSKAISLKNQIASFDDLLEKARTHDQADSNRMIMLYKKLQKFQSQFDSVKAKLELKDQHKIYSDTVEMFLDEIMAELNEKNYSIPHHMLERVKYYINLFTNDKRKATEILIRRKNIYFPEIEKTFQRKNIPPILGYVAMQESLLDTNARSSAGALGMWQFMENTGRRFNLLINNSIDERRDWRKSTVAAAEYFRSLLILFGDGRGVLLAIAAYNAGEVKIRRALEKVENPVRDRDFWYLYRTSTILAIETREYVPQVLARIIIDRHPQLYGF